MVRAFFALALGAVLFGLIAWQFELLPWQKEANTDARGGLAVEAKLDLGELLYKPAPFRHEIPARVHADEALAFVGTLQAVDKADVSAKKDVQGLILFVGKPLSECALQLAGIAPFIPEPYHVVEIPLTGGRKVVQFYERYYEQSTIDRNEIIAMVDPAKVLSEIDINRTKLEAAAHDVSAARALADEYRM